MLALTRLEMPRKIRCWRTYKPSWMLSHIDTLQNMGIVCYYPLEYGLIPFPETYLVPNINKYYGKGCPNQHIYHFHSLIGNIMGNDALMTRLFVESLKESLSTSLHFTSWIHQILDIFGSSHSHEDNTEVSMSILIEEKQRKGECVKDFIERFRNLSLRCPEGMPLFILL